MAICCAALMAAGCNNGETPEKQAAEPEPLAYTLYSEKTELFVEFKPLVVGTESRFAAHFTALGESFKAVGEGTITLTLTGPNGKQSITATKPEIPGIFRLRMTPKKAGTYTLIFDINTPQYKDRIVIENVKVYPNEQAAKADHKDTETSGGDITYLKEQAWKTDFANMPVRKQTFYEVIHTSGQIMAAPGDEVIITAKSSGIVFFNGSSAIVGSAVSQGQQLLTVSGKGLTENNINTKIVEARSNYEKAQADYERASDLVKDNVVSQKSYLETKNRYETAKSEYHSLTQGYTGSGTKITAPISGFIKNSYVQEGQYVNVGDPIASISQNRKIVLKADVSQRYFSKLAAVQSANFVTVEGATFNTSDLNGRLLAYGKSTTASGAFIPVTFEIDNRGEILPGGFVDVYLKSTPIPDALVIPLSALVEEQGTYFVYVQVKGESFSRREVKLGGNDGINVRVLSGIEEGERVVTKGAYNIKLSVASGTLPAHGHEH
jgi:membrane fusion protein, heavy metal efflux system